MILEDSFPLFIKPVTDFEHRDRHIYLNTLTTIPIIKDRNSLCTIESLIPLKYQQNHKCYSGPIAYNDLALITCPKSKIIIRADVLTKCYGREGTYLCPEEVLHSNHDSSWLGLPWTPGSRLNFPRNHVPTTCDSFDPLLHLGGRFYLSTIHQKIQLKKSTLSMTPLTVYSLPCNESSPSLKTGFGQCPTTLTMSIPIFARRVVKYIPWIVPANQTTLNLHYNSLKIGPRLRFNKSTIKALDETFARLEGPLNRKFKTIRDEISSIKETSATSTACNRLCSLSHHRPKYSCVDHHRLLYTTFAPQQAICYS